MRVTDSQDHQRITHAKGSFSPPPSQSSAWSRDGGARAQEVGAARVPVLRVKGRGDSREREITRKSGHAMRKKVASMYFFFFLQTNLQQC
jgi:hypothetical protein